MGLDIYFHRVKNARKRSEFKDEESRIDYLRFECGKQEGQLREKVRKIAADWIEQMEKTGADVVCGACLANDIYPYFEYDFYVQPLMSADTIAKVKAWYEDMNWNFSVPFAGYFRKVNSIYEYFSERLLENEMCEVTKDDALDLLERSAKVLSEKNEKTSRELLPTCDGFLFGSTDYDEWYYRDVAQISAVFAEMLADWEDKDAVYVYMSW